MSPVPDKEGLLYFVPSGWQDVLTDRCHGGVEGWGTSAAPPTAVVPEQRLPKDLPRGRDRERPRLGARGVRSSCGVSAAAEGWTFIRVPYPTNRQPPRAPIQARRTASPDTKWQVLRRQWLRGTRKAPIVCGPTILSGWSPTQRTSTHSRGFVSNTCPPVPLRDIRQTDLQAFLARQLSTSFPDPIHLRTLYAAVLDHFGHAMCCPGNPCPHDRQDEYFHIVRWALDDGKRRRILLNPKRGWWALNR